MSTLKHITSQSFDNEVGQSEIPVLIDFYADWCGPCRRLAPTLEKLSDEFDGRVKIVKVNVDDEPGLANRFQVQSIPTLTVLVHGEVVGQSSGALPENSLRGALEEIANIGDE